MSETINLVVVDLSHYDDPCSLAQAQISGIVGVIWKCTQGIDYLDGTYAKYKKIAAGLGMLWGAYHFIDTNSPEKQAEWFLKNADLGAGDLFCLDWEPNGTATAQPTAAAAWISAVESELNRPNQCVVYGSSSFLTDQIPAGMDNFFQARRLWVAQYGPTPTIPPTWKDYWLWQYAADGEGLKPNTVDGIPGNPDCNTFQGTAVELHDQWASGSSKPAPLPPPPGPAIVTVTIAAPSNVVVKVVKTNA